MYRSILTALDGSVDSLAGAKLAGSIARGLGCKLFVTHVYDTRIHSSRFQEMEPGLPENFRQGVSLLKLRNEHDTLMTEGFKSLSAGYMEDFIRAAGKAGIDVEEVLVENRNYVGILQLLPAKSIDLVVIGATGLGAQGDGLLGSTALRVLRKTSCDVLISRYSAEDNAGPLLAGVDGSDYALAALEKAQALSDILGRQLHIAAAFDVRFHQTVFKTMAQSLSADRQREIGLDRQEAVHEELIDKSLEALYGSYLKQATDSVVPRGRTPQPNLLRGKAYRALTDHAGSIGAGMVVMGRFGHNKEDISDVGSNAEAVVRLCRCSVLISNASGKNMPETKSDVDALVWDQEAMERLNRIPAHVRGMARKGIEEHIRSTGAARVTTAVFQKAAARFGMASAESKEAPEND